MRLRQVFILTILTVGAGNVAAAPNSSPEAEVIGRLAPAFASGDPARLAMAYRAMGDYAMPAADIVEASINALGYQNLANGDVEAAIAIFELNNDTFPRSANTWDSLGEAFMTSGDHEAAIRYYGKSLELDPYNSNATRMIERLKNAPQLSHVRGGVS